MIFIYILLGLNALITGWGWFFYIKNKKAREFIEKYNKCDCYIDNFRFDSLLRHWKMTALDIVKCQNCLLKENANLPRRL